MDLCLREILWECSISRIQELVEDGNICFLNFGGSQSVLLVLLAFTLLSCEKPRRNLFLNLFKCAFLIFIFFLSREKWHLILSQIYLGESPNPGFTCFTFQAAFFSAGWIGHVRLYWWAVQGSWRYRSWGKKALACEVVLKIQVFEPDRKVWFSFS